MHGMPPGSFLGIIITLADFAVADLYAKRAVEQSRLGRHIPVASVCLVCPRRWMNVVEDIFRAQSVREQS